MPNGAAPKAPSAPAGAASAAAAALRVLFALGVLAAGLCAHRPAGALDASPDATDKIKAGYEKVADEVLCYCGCARQTVHECSCSVAMDLRTDWERRLASGETPESIIDAYIAEHGEQSRNAPPRTGLNLVAWFGPGIAIAVAGTVTMVVIAVWAARGRRAREAAAAAGALAGAAGADPEVRQRLERELGEFDL